jgi:hypothetical protein
MSEGARWTQHVSRRARSEVPRPETDKERRIDAWVREQRSGTPGRLRKRDLVRRAEHRLVRLLCHWSSPYAAACAFSAEYAIIHSALGAYQLTTTNSNTWP